MKYSELNLDSRLNSAIETLNYVEATPIQEQTMPLILAAKDVAGLAQTGTGKTAAFLVPLIERILRTKEDPNHERAFKDWNARSFVLILVPTRELAEQINDNVVKIAQGSGLKSFPLYGGTGYEKQKEALQSGLQFVVSTPGRLIDLYKENHVDLKQVRAIVFDEADRMFDMGFKDDMKYILGRVPRDRQFLVFSATLNFDVLNTAYQFGAEPVEINISRDQATADHVKDFITHVGDDEKPKFLLSILKKQNPKQAIIFTNFKFNVDRVAAFLMNNKIPAMGISSLMSQTLRNQVMEKFKAENDQNILVATDVAARGLDINGVDLVINYEMPQDAESYVHRIGRTGRAGREGNAYSLISDKDIESLSRVEDYTKKKIEALFLEDADLVKDFVGFSSGEPRYNKKFDRGGPGGRDNRDSRGPRSRDQKRPDFRNGAGPQKDRGPRVDRPDNRTDNKTAQPAKAVHAHPRGPKPQHANKPQANHERKFDKKSNTSQDGNGLQLPKPNKTHSAKPTQSTGKNFRNNTTSSSRRVESAGVGQKVKSFLKRIFG
jgi:ATP-dependent RNA helicase RhlE